MCEFCENATKWNILSIEEVNNIQLGNSGALNGSNGSQLGMMQMLNLMTMTLAEDLTILLR